MYFINVFSELGHQHLVIRIFNIDTIRILNKAKFELPKNLDRNANDVIVRANQNSMMNLVKEPFLKSSIEFKKFFIIEPLNLTNLPRDTQKPKTEKGLTILDDAKPAKSENVLMVN